MANFPYGKMIENWANIIHKLRVSLILILLISDNQSILVFNRVQVGLHRFWGCLDFVANVE